MPELLGLSYSPWSEKARWALEVRRVAYTSRTYAPLVGEPALRLKVGKWTGPVTVPVLTDDEGRVFADSADIARWADAHGEGPTLFPAEHDEAIRGYVLLSERGLAAGRALSLGRMKGDRDALREMVPKGIRRVLGPVAATVGALGIARTLRKYRAAGMDHEADLRAVLDELRAALARRAAPPDGGPKTLLGGGLTFADIAMAQVLAFVKPAAFGVRMGTASRRNFTDAVFAEHYADLVAWRDALYERHRPKT